MASEIKYLRTAGEIYREFLGEKYNPMLDIH